MNNLLDKICKFINENYDYTEEVADYIYKNPELGFKEFKTNEYVKTKLDEMDIAYESFDDVTGIKVTLDSGREGANIAILAELDALSCSSHVDSDKETGAVHACGHNVMVADVLTIIKLFSEMNIMNSLSGKISFLIVPAEEYGDMDYRLNLIRNKTISYPTGKSEMISRGFFDGIDACIMMHLMPGKKHLGLETGGNGFLAKKITYTGKAAHAASKPENGVNALYAANLGLMAVNSIRETFKESSCVRVHPIISKGGDAMNVIPDDVHIETLVRANNIDDICDINNKINRAFAGGAISMGAEVMIQDTPGMLPLNTCDELMSLAKEVALNFISEDEISVYEPSKGSSDLGDVSALMPAIEICIECVDGGLHTSDFSIYDKEKAYNFASKMLAIMAVKLLENDGDWLEKALKNYTPYFSCKEEYLDFMNGCFAKRVYKSDVIMRK